MTYPTLWLEDDCPTFESQLQSNYEAGFPSHRNNQLCLFRVDNVPVQHTHKAVCECCLSLWMGTRRPGTADQHGKNLLLDMSDRSQNSCCSGGCRATDESEWSCWHLSTKALNTHWSLWLLNRHLVICKAAEERKACFYFVIQTAYFRSDGEGMWKPDAFRTNTSCDVGSS